MPIYQNDKKLKVDREVNCPPNSDFIGLGWDEDSKTGRKHYRRFYYDELENVTDVMGDNPSVFNSYDLKRGQSRGTDASFFERITNKFKTDASGAVTNEKVTGKFKAVIKVESMEEKSAYETRKNNLIHKLTENLT
jgi:hypothetical protein